MSATKRLTTVATRTFNPLSSVFHLEITRSRVVLRRLNAHLQKRTVAARSSTTLSTQRNSVVSHDEPSDIPLSEQPIPPAKYSQRDTSSILLSRNNDTIPLPLSCPGCGAFSQELDTDQAGHYTRNRKAVRQYLHRVAAEAARSDTVENATADGEGQSLGMDAPKSQNELHTTAITTTITPPVCDRCHDLIYYSRGQPISHPSLDDIADSIAESPFKRNHVYHVIDAADFPMSTVPAVLSKLNLARQRSQNRRSQHDFSAKPTLSFIITRADLLGPSKEMVDSMMPFFQKVLRDTLGRNGQDLRLGNVHLVSAKRGWWTKEIKESIWKRGGGTWLIGKFNVGKSNLFEVLFPKGSGDRAPVYAKLRREATGQAQPEPEELALPETSLLPPAQKETPFPVFPLVSSLPGTTASPIRLPFGNDKGELIDLPGLERRTLDAFVSPEHKGELIMQNRENVDQHVIAPGQSLILGGGLVRITPDLHPHDKSGTVLAYPFVPLKAHVTSTEKAIAQQSQQRHSGIESILAEDVGQHIKSAGRFELQTDVTRAHAGPLLRAGVPAQKLPFRVYSTDILIEGIGWVELVSQVRLASSRQSASIVVARTIDKSSDPPAEGGAEQDFAPFSKANIVEQAATVIGNDQVTTEKSEYPTVEVFTPSGACVGSRPALGAWTKWSEHRKRSSRGKSNGRGRSVGKTRMKKRA